eukprot:EST48826.1 Hypothetical protein SS50377_10922 [Spironucleus salmonicida]
MTETERALTTLLPSVTLHGESGNIRILMNQIIRVTCNVELAYEKMLFQVNNNQIFRAGKQDQRDYVQVNSVCILVVTMGKQLWSNEVVGSQLLGHGIKKAISMIYQSIHCQIRIGAKINCFV